MASPKRLTSGCQDGKFPRVNLVTIATGAVKGKRLKNVAKGPLGASENIEFNISGKKSGNVTRNEN